MTFLCDTVPKGIRELIEAMTRPVHKEEIANSITHGIGLALSVAGLAVLIVLAALHGSAWHIVSCSVYGASLVLLYAASTLYHSMRSSERSKRQGARRKKKLTTLHQSVRSSQLKHIFRVVDHSSIYVLIAGTYTPFTLVILRGHWGWTLFGLVWGLSLLGILFKIFFVDHFMVVSTTVYLMLGWLAIIAIKPLLALVPSGGVLWLLSGGAAYTIGVVFFAWRRIPYHHAVWHVFVMAGSICHYFAVLFYVLPAKA